MSSPPRTVLWLDAPPRGTLGASDDACKDYPTVLDKSTIQEYGEKCGKQKLKEWVQKETGVDVGKCLDGDASLKQSPECIANNYGIKLGVIKDGEVQWDVVVHDAGAVGGIAVCAATGVGAAGLSLCGKIGGELGDIAFTIVEPFVGVFVKFFWGEDEKITYCNLAAPVDLVKVQLPGYAAGSVQSLAQWMANPYAANLPGALGPVLFPGGLAGTKAYWSKILIMRGLAQASAIVLRDFLEQTGLPVAKGLEVLDLKAPPGWIELVRPEYDGKPHDDVRLNIGALLDAFLAPEVIRKARGEGVIVPSYLLPNFWAGIPSAGSITNFFELQNVNEGCITTVMWGKRDPKIQKPSGPAYQRAKMQVYWEYTTPVVVNALALADNATFQKSMNAWRASLKQSLKDKIAKGKALASAKPVKSSGVGTVLLVGGAAALAWWLWPAAGLFENPRQLARGRVVKASTLQVGDVISGYPYHNHHVKIVAGPSIVKNRFGQTLTEWEGEIVAGDQIGKRGLLSYGPEGSVRLVTSLRPNPRLPKGATLQREDSMWVLRFQEGGYREFPTKQEAVEYLGGLAP